MAHRGLEEVRTPSRDPGFTNRALSNPVVTNWVFVERLGVLSGVEEGAFPSGVKGKDSIESFVRVAHLDLSLSVKPASPQDRNSRRKPRWELTSCGLRLAERQKPQTVLQRFELAYDKDEDVDRRTCGLVPSDVTGRLVSGYQNE